MRVLERETGYSYDGIRGRISELRKMGYTIIYDGSRYHLKQEKEKNITDAVRSAMKKERLFDMPILITQLEYITGFKKQELMHLFIQLSKHNKLVQLSQNKVLIHPF